MERDDVGAAHPAGELGEVEVGDPEVGDGDDVGADLAGVAPLVLADLGGEGAGGEDEDEVFGLVGGLLDLAPPVLAALHGGEVLPEGDAQGFELAAEAGGGVGAVVAGIGDEDAGELVVVRHEAPSAGA